ncbi:MAG: hypothetical protein KAJ92_02600 [Gammaproteobacteria bacterium]|nr:hypothetical protein [Gammaproteobacteria bacterium]MCK5262542.1 hypothetical protein [Gammaproteobacteria bacterium]
MKAISIIMLAFSLLLSNTAMATSDGEKSNIDVIEQAKANILKAVSVHIDVLNKFKSCVAMARVGPDLGACKKQKKAALKALRDKVKLDRASQAGSKKKEAK